MAVTENRQRRADVDLSCLQVIRRKIPIRIKNVENPRGLGSVIHPNSDLDGSETREILLPEPVSSDKLDYLRMVDQGHKKLPTAVTIKEHIVVLNIHSNRKSVSHGFLAGIFGTLDRYGMAVDLISTSEVHISMAIEDRHEKKVMDRLVKELEKYGTVSPRSISLHSQLGVRGSDTVLLKSGHCAAKNGHPVIGGKAEKHGRDSWTHVHVARTGERQY